jgi:hypothetical protein
VVGLDEAICHLSEGYTCDTSFCEKIFATFFATSKINATIGGSVETL